MLCACSRHRRSALAAEKEKMCLSKVGIEYTARDEIREDSRAITEYSSVRFFAAMTEQRSLYCVSQYILMLEVNIRTLSTRASVCYRMLMVEV